MSTRILALAVLTAAFCLGGGISYLISHNSKEIGAVQQARVDSILLSCTQGNERHDNTITTLKQIYRKAVAQHPRRKERIQKSLAPTVFLVNALAPKFNCQHRVEVLAR